MDSQELRKRIVMMAKKFNQKGTFQCRDTTYDTKEDIHYDVKARIRKIEYSPKKNHYNIDVATNLNELDDAEKGEFGLRRVAQKDTIGYFRTLLHVYGLKDESFNYSWNLDNEDDDYEMININENVDLFEKVKKFITGRKVKVGDKFIFKVEGMRHGKGTHVIIDYSVVTAPDMGDSHYSVGDVFHMEMERWFKEYFDFPVSVVPHIVFPNSKTLGVPVSEQECEGGMEDIGILPLGGPRKKKKKDTQEQTDSGSSGAVETATQPIIRRELNKLKESEAFHHPVSTHDMEVPMRYERFKRLMRDIEKYVPGGDVKVNIINHELNQCKIKGKKPDWNGIVRELIHFVEMKGMDISPNWQVVPDTRMNENEDYGGDGASIEDWKYVPEKVKLDAKSIDAEKLDRLLLSLKELKPEYFNFAYSYLSQAADAEGYVQPSHVLGLIDYLNRMEVIISPNWQVVPNPELNEIEKELDEATDYSSSGSGSYETPGCWATGKGKQSIKNSRAAKSKQFKKFLYGGPKAKYVSVKGSVNTLDETTDIYNESTDMKKSQIQKLVESTIKAEVVKALQQKPMGKVVNEDTFLQEIDAMISEEKHPAQTQFEKMHKESGKINKKSNSETDKTMNSYADFKGNDKPEFPKAISKPTAKKGEDGEVKKRENSDQEQEFIDDFKGMGLEDLMFNLEPNEEYKERADMSLKGDKLMGNASGKDTANTIETETGDEMEKKAKRKGKKLADAPMYNKDVQPTGKKSDEKDLKGSALSESVETEMAKIMKLYKYSDRTQ